jgi:hypothetical protein
MTIIFIHISYNNLNYNLEFGNDTMHSTDPLCTMDRFFDLKI